MTRRSDGVKIKMIDDSYLTSILVIVDLRKTFKMMIEKMRK